MRCTSPRTVGFKTDGKTISWSQKEYSKEFATFQLPCSKCIECRLEYARQWAVRCVHEAAIHKENSFVTLTYTDENLKSPKLHYIDFQLFVKRLRRKRHREMIKKIGKLTWSEMDKDQKKQIEEKYKISIFVTGEYGQKTKRPHWHACIFNWEPSDPVYKYSNERGDKVYESQELTDLWGHGIAEFGSVTFQSAGYCARYAAKKLVHGHDGHEYEPISKKSSHQAIGKRWLEKYHADVFNYGHIVLHDGTTCSIPRYYEKWYKLKHPEKWSAYVTKTKQEKIDLASNKENSERAKEKSADEIRRTENPFSTPSAKRLEARKIINEQKFQMLQDKLKL